MTKADMLAAALDDFLAVSPEVEAAAVVSADGLPMASALPPHVEEDRLAAMSAALLTLGERAAEGLGKGELAQVFVEGGLGHVILMSAGGNAVLVAVSSQEAKVGLVLFEMRKTAARVHDVMNEGVPAETPAPVPAPVSAYGAAETPAPASAPAPTAPVAAPATEPYNGSTFTGTTQPAPAAAPSEPAPPARAPETTPATETESSVSSWT
jgi:predicted regulator of Ras-like GTPase activity (Roadblock/LC7/MglB family)